MFHEVQITDVSAQADLSKSHGIAGRLLSAERWSMPAAILGMPHVGLVHVVQVCPNSKLVFPSW